MPWSTTTVSLLLTQDGGLWGQRGNQSVSYHAVTATSTTDHSRWLQGGTTSQLAAAAALCCISLHRTEKVATRFVATVNVCCSQHRDAFVTFRYLVYKCCYRLLEHASHNSNICLCLCPVVCTVWLRDVATAAADADARTQRNPYSSASSACHLLYGYRRCWPRRAMWQNKVSIQRFLSAFTSFY